jgi:hypothetical protein
MQEQSMAKSPPAVVESTTGVALGAAVTIGGGAQLHLWFGSMICKDIVPLAVFGRLLCDRN